MKFQFLSNRFRERSFLRPLIVVVILRRAMVREMQRRHGFRVLPACQKLFSQECPDCVQCGFLRISKGKFHGRHGKKATNCSGKLCLTGDDDACPRRVGENDKRCLLLLTTTGRCMFAAAGIGSHS